MSKGRGITLQQAECLGDETGRAKIISYLYDHPDGLTFSELKTLENQRLQALYPSSQNILHHIPERLLSDFLVDLEIALIITEEAGSKYRLKPRFRNFLDNILSHAEKEHAQYSRKEKGV